jgi:hypothetical protein
MQFFINEIYLSLKFHIYNYSFNTFWVMFKSKIKYEILQKAITPKYEKYKGQ